MAFKTFTADDAPDASRAALAGAERMLGFIPNLMAKMAGAPALLKGYQSLAAIFETSSFDMTERQVITLTVSRENKCHYCMAAHTVSAGMQNIDMDIVNAIRQYRPIEDQKLHALSEFTKDVVNSRGYPREDSIKNLKDAGYNEQQILEVILGVAVKTMSNYANHIAGTDLDDAFKSAEWSD